MLAISYALSDSPPITKRVGLNNGSATLDWTVS